MPLAVTRCRITDALFDVSVSGRCSRRASAPLPVIDRPSPPSFAQALTLLLLPIKTPEIHVLTSLLYAIFVVK